MTKYIIILIFLLPTLVGGQALTGIVADDKDEVLVGANLHWIGTEIGTSSNEYGGFDLTLTGISDKRLIVSYIGHQTDTVLITTQTSVYIPLNHILTINEIKVRAENPGTYISAVKPVKTEVITEVEIGKSACCDLAGCFNTQASVQPTTTNVVTNAKELRILGLSGVYNQILIDGMPLVQGLSYTYGINTIPGTLVRNIYVAKGANSVLQGYESISGQINVELKEPDKGDRFFFNAYFNSFQEKQINVNYSHRWKKWRTLFAAHTTQAAEKFDRDEDTFLDLPLVTRYSFYNKWTYGNKDQKGWHSRIGLRYVTEQRVGGQVDFDPFTDEGTTKSYGQTVQFSQPEMYTKTGYRVSDKHHFVFLVSGFQQKQSTYFGTTHYEAEQLSVYANFQYELTWRGKHSLKMGSSFRYLNLDENISFGQDSLNRTYAGEYLKKEQIPGVFVENTFNWKENDLVLITGIRLDKHNVFGWKATPRALLKYNFNANTTARISVGTGWRTLNLFSENVNLLASSRDIIITEELKPEQAINYGVNLTHNIYGENIETQLSLDFYRTQFLNQIFPDYDTDPTQAFISNFTGTSISNGFLAEVKFEFFKKITTKIGYNFLDVYRILDEKKFVLPFNPKHRITSTFSYKPTSEKWHFDMDVHWYGKQGLANTSKNPEDFQAANFSEVYTLINAQFTKTWKRLEIYGGCENIFDFRQKRGIISWQDPFGKYFDTSSVWGPIKGREFYIGVRYKVK